MAQRRRRQTRHQPKPKTEGCIDTPTVHQRILRRGGETTMGKPGTLRQEGRGMQLDRGNELQRAAQQQPNQRRTKEDQARPFG